MFCRNCGSKVKPDSELCDICGMKVSNGENYCPECGHICIPGDEICVSCGTPLSNIHPQHETQASPPIINKEANIGEGPKYLSTGKIYCRNCGLVIDSGSEVCPYCECKVGNGNNYCNKCGSGTIATDKVCHVCSAPLTIVQNAHYIPSQPPIIQHNSTIHQQYQVNVNANRPAQQSNKTEYQKSTSLLLAILPAMFGFCGVHRLYTGHILSGIAQLLTGGMCFVWQLIDIILIASNNFRDKNGHMLSE